MMMMLVKGIEYSRGKTGAASTANNSHTKLTKSCQTFRRRQNQRM